MGAEPPNLGTTIILLATPLGLTSYWWLVLVPSERRSLARSKRKGGLNRYLEDLEGDESRGLERWFYTDYLNQRKGRRARRRDQAKALADASSDGIDLDEELDRAEEEASAADPNFLSLDNPIVVATVSLALFTAFAALQGKA